AAGVDRGCEFLFHAEDGIRDRNVTGVQTCAIPISRTGMIRARTGRAPIARAHRVPPLSIRSPSSMALSLRICPAKARRPRAPRRSEERRVGKEGKEVG